MSCILLLLSVLALTTPPDRVGVADTASLPSITDTSMAWPTLEELLNVLLLRDYNTRLVVLSTAILGLAAGVVGTFLLLRKRALIGDALSHATLPGIALAFIVMVAAGGTGKFLPGLLLGAALFGLLGVGCVLLIKGLTRLKDDAALGIVLSVFFGLGVALLGIVQQMPEGSQAGLESFIYGKTASMIRSDLLLIGGAATVVALVSGLLYKEFTLLCFDAEYASSQGWPAGALDIVMMVLVTAVTVIGLQAVGLILIIALLIIPPAAARFWTERLWPMLLGAALIGAVGGWLGASLSALVPRLPAGAIIVVVCATIFLLSMIFGSSRGVVRRLSHHGAWRNESVGSTSCAPSTSSSRWIGRSVPSGVFTLAEILPRRSWSMGQLRRLVRRAARRGLIRPHEPNRYQLTEEGWRDAVRVARNHRLWELFLITHADIAPSHVDRDADQIEHVLGPSLVAELESQLGFVRPETPVPPSPHAL